MQLSTTRFGSIQIDSEQIVTFPDGLPGFEERRRFALVPHPGAAPGGLLHWLQCADADPAAGELAFPVIDPRHVAPDYAPAFAPSALRDMGIGELAVDAQVLGIVTIPRHKPSDATVNLLAPIVVSARTRTARQMILISDAPPALLRTPLRPAAPPSPRASASRSLADARRGGEALSPRVAAAL